jgi:dodecin
MALKLGRVCASMESDSRVAHLTEVVAASPKSFEDAIRLGLKTASKTTRGITGLRIVDQHVTVKEDHIKEYRVRMEVFFVLEQ